MKKTKKERKYVNPVLAWSLIVFTLAIVAGALLLIYLPAMELFK